MPDLMTEYCDRLPVLEELAVSLEKITRELVEALPHIDRVGFRVKDPKSFVAKASDPQTKPPYTVPLSQIEDQVAGRVITFFLQDLEPVKECLSTAFNAVEVTHKRPAKDDAFGYESHHLILIVPPHVKPDGWDELVDPPTTFEMQVRTVFMHAWSEPQHDLAYKAATDLPPTLRRELAWVAASAWGGDQGLARVWKSLQERAGAEE